MSKTTSELRALWKKFECNEAEMVVVPFHGDRIRVAPATVPAWEALAAVMAHHGYEIRTIDTDSYNCRSIKGTNEKSLHSFGIALDVNWTTNPFIDHAGKRGPRFSGKASQAERAGEVRLGLADTDMTKAMIDDVLAIRTLDGVQVFEWGGNWKSVKDAMHFELDLSPAELAKGIDPSTVNADPAELAPVAADVSADATVTADAAPVAPVPPAPVGVPHKVVARNGLRLRAGPSTDFGIILSMAAGTRVFVPEREGDWSAVDLQGDGLIDGFAFSAFLKPVAAAMAPAAPPVVPTAPVAAQGDVAVGDVAVMFPFTPRANIERNLPFVLAGLAEHGLSDRSMVLMALATIRAETEGFVPISEGRSRFNTRVAPFDLYDAGTSIGRRLGNTVAGDGPRFKGRGYVQLTGRFNYTRIGGQLGVDLAGNPELANDPAIAGRILARFLKNGESRIRSALERRDLRAARRAVNGGSHGLDRFSDAFTRGEAALA